MCLYLLIGVYCFRKEKTEVCLPIPLCNTLQKTRNFPGTTGQLWTIVHEL